MNPNASVKEKESLERLREEEDRLVSNAVAAAGFESQGVYDLVKKDLPSEVVQVLLSLMKTVSHPAIKQGVIRALATPVARGVAARFDKLFRRDTRIWLGSR